MRLYSLLLILLLSCHTDDRQQRKAQKAAPTLSINVQGSDPTQDTSFIRQLGQLYGEDTAQIIHDVHAWVDSLGGNGAQGEFITSVYQLSVPDSKAYVNDYDLLFSASERRNLDSMISSYQGRTGHQIAIVTLNASWTTLEAFDALICDIGNYWGVGRATANDGIVIGISKGLYRVRISTGKGIGQQLPDTIVKQIIDRSIVPSFRQDAYFKGTADALVQLMQRLP